MYISYSIPGLLISSSSLTDLADTIPAMCTINPLGNDVSV